MNIVVRADSSTAIGTGHLMRCLTLADTLRHQGAEVSFVCRDLPGNISEYVTGKGFKAYRLPAPLRPVTGASALKHASWLGVEMKQDLEDTLEIVDTLPALDWLIVDHYALDFDWERAMRRKSKKIAVIDDLADRRHDCDLLLDQNLYKNMESRYDALAPGDCNRLLGPKYAMLRPEFAQVRQSLRVRDGSINRILVFSGGSDPSNETAKALEAIRLLNRRDLSVDVVVGGANTCRAAIKESCAGMPHATYHCQIENMAELMSEADLAIGAGGTATWERCFLGLPSLVITIAMNQLETTEYLSELGCVWFCGSAATVTSSLLAQRLARLLDEPLSVLKASVACQSIVDGAGCDRVYGCMEQMLALEKYQ